MDDTQGEKLARERTEGNDFAKLMMVVRPKGQYWEYWNRRSDGLPDTT